ncbi:respiratory nitrate reductase 1 subunit beta [Salmonella enterica subsp. enterica]|nr:respiratory nitrate reductase 1 subunit beta [Salmonella enterica subsp. enterica]
MCITGCPYKKIYFNWKSGKSEKCIFCYPRIEAGQPTVCSETCVGRIRYLGVLLYDADAIESAASTENEKDLYQRQLDVFLDPNDPAVIEQALKDGVPQSVIDAAQQSPVYKMAIDWKLALPLHPEYRTLPMVWYVPPFVTDSVCRRCGRTWQQRYSAGCRQSAYPGAVPGEPVDCWRHPAGTVGAETDAGDASLQTCGNRRR